MKTETNMRIKMTEKRVEGITNSLWQRNKKGFFIQDILKKGTK